MYFEKRFQNGSHILYYQGSYSRGEQYPVQGAMIFLKNGKALRFYTNQKGSLFPKSIYPNHYGKEDVKAFLEDFSKMNDLHTGIKSPAGAYAKALAILAKEKEAQDDEL